VKQTVVTDRHRLVGQLRELEEIRISVYVRLSALALKIEAGHHINRNN